MSNTALTRPLSLRQRLRAFRLGLLTLTGWQKRGFFIPSRHANDLGAMDYPALAPLFADAEPAFASLFKTIDSHAPAFAAMAAANASPRFTQDWFARLDACAAYALVRREKPQRIVEIGSGHSSRFMARAVADGTLPTRITCIDPFPRASLAQTGVVHIKSLLSRVDPLVFDALQDGDMLFVDSSHVAMPGSDVDRIVLDILPRLPPGTWVHFHDITLPDAYPPEMAAWGYNEQGMIGALLQGGAYELVWSSHYVATRMAGMVAASPIAGLPLPESAIEASIWLRKLR